MTESSVTSVVALDGGVAIGTAALMLVIDVSCLRPTPSAVPGFVR